MTTATQPRTYTLTLTLPFPVSFNEYYKPVVRWRRGKPYPATILSVEARTFRAQVVFAARCAGLAGLNLESQLRVNVDLYAKTRRAIDVDNFNKGIFDGLTKAKFWLDDKQAKTLTTDKCGVLKGGQAVVTILEL